jgi:hypothetical protein
MNLSARPRLGAGFAWSTDNFSTIFHLEKAVSRSLKGLEKNWAEDKASGHKAKRASLLLSLCPFQM